MAVQRRERDLFVRMVDRKSHHISALLDLQPDWVVIEQEMRGNVRYEYQGLQHFFRIKNKHSMN